MSLFRYSFVFLIFGLTSVAWSAAEQNTVETYLRESSSAGKAPNHLIGESSPYLLQHAYNPVQWYAWGEEAFARAKKENKPIFLSIGYSTCHWCHVMAHESFENKEIADFLNKYFVSVKVDREERPDIDNVYMAATQLVNGHGGWPMTIVMNHDLEPFFAGTYYPAESADGYRGLKELLMEITRLWAEERDRVEEVAKQIAIRIKAEADESGPKEVFNKFNERIALQQISGTYDEEFGGFSAAPKFPRPRIFSLLLKLAQLQNDNGDHALNMIKKTLTAMAQGGIYDQVGGGFHRYSVDRRWQVPHFEKMLYSQALLATSYMRLYEIESKPLYRKVAQETLGFVLREMTSPQGGFYSALDADSEHPERKGHRAEGVYYLWGEAELTGALSDDEIDFFSEYHSISKSGNIDSDPNDEFADLNILYVNEEFSSKRLTTKQKELLASAKSKLLKKREGRPRPHLDDKVIAAWNGMMINAFAEAYGIFNEKKYLSAAINSSEFVRKQMIDIKSGMLYRSIREGSASIEAGLSDYVWYIRSLIKLHETTSDKKWLELAIKLSKKQNELFLDEDNGGYFDAVGDDSTLLFRSKSIYDGALPAANSIALSNLNDLFAITKDAQWKEYASDLLGAFAGAINNNPAATSMVLSAVE